MVEAQSTDDRVTLSLFPLPSPVSWRTLVAAMTTPPRPLAIRLRALFVGAIVFVGFGAVLFLSAGRLDVPMFWVLLGVWFAAMAIGIGLIPADLLRERLRPGPGARERWFKPVMVSLGVSQFLLAGLDVGHGWFPGVPWPIQLAALGVFVAGLVVGIWAQVTNRYFSSVVRIQTDRGQRVVSEGPYAWIRHPGYAVGISNAVAGPLVLGSWIAVIPAAFMAAAFVTRIRLEERMLRAELAGYEEYAQRVRHRLVPGIW